MYIRTQTERERALSQDETRSRDLKNNDEDSDRIMCVDPTHPDMQSPGRVFDPGRGKRKDGGDGGGCEIVSTTRVKTIQCMYKHYSDKLMMINWYS